MPTRRIAAEPTAEGRDERHEPTSGGARTGRPIDKPKIERAVREILEAIGEDPERDGLLRTPERIAKMYEEIFAGLHEDPSHHLTVTFEADHDEMVMVRDIPLNSVCEHHLIPFAGRGARRLHPRRRRPDHRLVEDRPPGRRLLPSGRRCRSG